MFKDEKGADDGGVLIEEEPSDQESNEPTDPVNNMASEIPKEGAQKTFPQTEKEPENLNPLANEESAKESPKKQVPKNIVTSWSDWVAKTTTSVNKKTKESTTTSTSPSDQESNKPTDQVNKMASEISKEDTQKTPPQTEEEPENLKPLANEESAKESPKKQVPKNIVTSWSDWVAKTTTSVNKEPEESTNTSTSQPRVKRLAELFFSLTSKLMN